MDNNLLKVFVFIARDSKEYNKYILEAHRNDERGGDNRECAKNKNERYQWRYNRANQCLRTVIEKGKLGTMGWRLLAPATYEDRLSDNLRDFRKTNGPALEEKIKVRVRSLFAKLQEDTNTESSGFLYSLLSNLKDDEDKVLLDLSGTNVQCRIFIHWGGGEREDVLFYEREVTKLLDNRWKLFSLGTNRNNLFNVDRDRIIIPASVKELDEIEKKFANEQDFGGVVADSALTKIANRAEKLVGDDIEALSFLMHEMKQRILFSSLNMTKKKEFLVGIAEIESKLLAECSVNTQGTVEISGLSVKAVSVARKILNKEVFHG